MIKHLIFFTLPLYIFTSCSPKHETTQQNNTTVASADTVIKETFEKGKVVNKVICHNDITLNYALYLPSNYNEQKHYPVIIAFDAHARGFRPIEMYHALAERYGYIIAGSNNSKNGMNTDETNNIAKTMVNEIQQRFSVDTSRIYTAGFSGGARVAASAAIFNGGIAGVIGCGAGFPATSEPITTKFNFIGIAGTDDFNFTELKKLDASLDNTTIPHQLLLFEGIHDWCPPDVMNDAFIWIECNAMRDHLINKNDTLIKSFQHSQEKKMEDERNKNNLLDAYYTCKKIINYLNGLCDITKYKKQLAELQSNASLKKEMAYHDDMERTESEHQQFYSSSFLSKDLIWWNNELKTIDAKIKDNKNHEETLMWKRLKGYLGLAVYSFSNHALQANDNENAARFLSIYKTLEPDNTEVYYLTATLYARKGENDKALQELRTAIQKGFNDKQRLIDENDFDKLRQDPEFGKIIAEIKE